jgi:hypothetical protein
MAQKHFTILPAGTKTYLTQAEALADAKRMCSSSADGMVVYEAICIARADGTVGTVETYGEPEPADVA